MTPAELRTFRKRRGLTQAAFARLVGQEDRGTVSRWEDGKRAIPEATVIICGLIEQFPEVEQWLMARASGDSGSARQTVPRQP